MENHPASSEPSVRMLRRAKFCAVAVGGLMLAGIAALMVLSAGKGEDITGIVAPALLIALVAAVVATVASVLQTRAQKAIGTGSQRFHRPPT